jgi:guanylate kinase
VKGLGLDYLVSEVSNTLLKAPKVGKHIPTVAERTQGEVIGFAASATERMGKDGFVVLLEGREQTVDYVPSPLRYTLTMSDTLVLGQRRAAQRLGAAVLGGMPKPEEVEVEVTKGAGGAEGEKVVPGVLEPSEELVSDTLTVKLDELAYEAGCEPELAEELTVKLAIGSPMGLTVREIEPDNFLLVTGVEPGGQGCRSGVRIGYFLREVAGTSVASLPEVFAALKKAKEEGGGGSGDGASSTSPMSFELKLTASPPSSMEPTSPAGLRGVSAGRASSASSPIPLVIAGPSGVGKGTLIGKVLQEFPGMFGFSVSHTTRAPRAGEEDGRDYHFSTKEVMEKEIAVGGFLEHANVHGNFYGTSFDAVKDVAGQGKVCILDIDVQGCKSVKACAASAMPQQPHFIFIAPPSMEVLSKRLTARGTETPEKVQLRLSAAKGEVEYGLTPGNMELVIVNDVLEEAFQELVEQLAKWYPQVKAALGPDAHGDDGDGEGEGSDQEEEEEGEDEETPEEFLVRCGLGHYAPAFTKFGVETAADLETSARLLTDEELAAELGMADQDIDRFREIFGGASEEEEEEEGDEDEDDEDDDL